MIGSFWNLCRACPSMPVDKVSLNYPEEEDKILILTFFPCDTCDYVCLYFVGRTLEIISRSFGRHKVKEKNNQFFDTRDWGIFSLLTFSPYVLYGVSVS